VTLEEAPRTLKGALLWLGSQCFRLGLAACPSSRPRGATVVNKPREAGSKMVSCPLMTDAVEKVLLNIDES
jgi:hypothetical protein